MPQSDKNHVLFEKVKNAGVITLNRPKVLNALNTDVVVNLWHQILEWEKDTVLILIRGAGKSFCAGGDLIQVSSSHSGIPFAVIEYNVNFLISTLKIPYVALLDGVTMGGGLGVSIHGKYRVATENTVVAMPETKIGLIPDVGGTYFLPRLPFRLGFYLALTSNKIKGEDAFAAGIATHFVASTRLTKLTIALTECRSEDNVQEVLARFHQEPEDPALKPHLELIEHCFSAPTVEEIIRRLEAANDDWCLHNAMTIRSMCPVSLKLTLKALHKGAKLDLWQCLRMEFRLTSRLSYEHNFREGVRALLIDKDNNPKWIPRTLEEVNDIDLCHYFDPLPNNNDLKRFNYKTSKI